MLVNFQPRAVLGRLRASDATGRRGGGGEREPESQSCLTRTPPAGRMDARTPGARHEIGRGGRRIRGLKMTDIHADGPPEDVTRPADRADIARLDGRIDRSGERTERLIETIRAEMRADRAEMRADQAEMRSEFRDGIGRVQASVDELRKDVQSLNKWKWSATAIVGAAVVIAAAILRVWPGG